MIALSTTNETMNCWYCAKPLAMRNTMPRSTVATKTGCVTTGRSRDHTFAPRSGIGSGSGAVAAEGVSTASGMPHRHLAVEDTARPHEHGDEDDEQRQHRGDAGR